MTCALTPSRLSLLHSVLAPQIFLGSLREAEVERVNERISQAVMETCLAMTIFREEFNISFVAMFATLTFVKVFHWLVQDRVDYVETTPSISVVQHLRILSFMCLLLVGPEGALPPNPLLHSCDSGLKAKAPLPPLAMQLVDNMFLQYTITETIKHGPSVLLLFAFEYVIQASVVVSTALKYFLIFVDNAMEGRWESKGVYVFYLELITDMFHLFVYLLFFVIVFSYYGLPLHLVRDLYWTFRNFRQRVSDFLRYRRVTANMNERFPNATPEDLARCDNTCIICREEMAPEGANKKLPCGHVFHLPCLRSWLERQQNCPTCRANVLTAPGAADSNRRAPAAAADENNNAEAAPPGAGGLLAPPSPPPESLNPASIPAALHGSRLTLPRLASAEAQAAAPAGAPAAAAAAAPAAAAQQPADARVQAPGAARAPAAPQPHPAEPPAAANLTRGSLRHRHPQAPGTQQGQVRQQQQQQPRPRHQSRTQSSGAASSGGGSARRRSPQQPPGQHQHQQHPGMAAWYPLHQPPMQQQYAGQQPPVAVSMPGGSMPTMSVPMVPLQLLMPQHAVAVPAYSGSATPEQHQASLELGPLLPSASSAPPPLVRSLSSSP